MSGQTNDIGKILKTEREKRALSLDVVHETTKIPMDSLRAIEEGYKIRTLSTFYYKSFVKIYAKYLGMDADKLLAMIPSSHSAVKAAEPLAKAVAKPKLSDSLDRADQLNLFARQGSSGRMVKKIGKGVLIGAVVVGCLALVIGIVRNISRNRSAVPVSASTGKKPAVNVSKVKTEAPKKVDPKTAEPSKAVSQGPVAAKKEAVPAASADTASAKAVRNISLTVRAKATAWLKVKVDGNTVFQGSLKKNNHVTWSGQKRIELLGKDIDQLDYEANGKAIGKIGRPNSRIKKVVVTPDGLAVEK